MAAPIRPPDLSTRPFNLETERTVALSADAIYRAWTEGFDRWFAAPGSVLMRAEVNTPFFWETEHRLETDSVAQRHPHYGRFLRLEPGRLIEMTWVTGTGGTNGAETVVTVTLTPQAEGTRLHLSHRGFADGAARDQHAQAWPMVLEQMETRLRTPS